MAAGVATLKNDRKNSLGREALAGPERGMCPGRYTGSDYRDSS